MNEKGNDLFRRWSEYTLLPVPALGVGMTIEARIMEGRGELLPGRPKGGAPKPIHIDPMGPKVDKFIATLSPKDRLIVKVHYLSIGLNVAEKAKACGLPVRTMYYRLDRIQTNLAEFVTK